MKKGAPAAGIEVAEGFNAGARRWRKGLLLVGLVLLLRKGSKDVVRLGLEVVRGTFLG